MTRGSRQRFTATALGVLAGAVAATGTLAVAAAGFLLSYDAVRGVGIAAYIREGWAWLLPMSVDGAMAVATVAAVVLRRMGRSPRYPWLVVVAGAGISVGCNALHAYMEGGLIKLVPEVAMAVSAIPAVMLALSVHLLVVLVDVAAGTLRTGQEDAKPALVSSEGRPQTPPSPPAQAIDRQEVLVAAPAIAAPVVTAVAEPELPPQSDRQDELPLPEVAAPATGNGKARHTGDEVRQLATEITAERGQLPRTELAALIGISDRTLRHHLANGKEAQ